MSDHEPQYIELVENDTLPQITPTFTGVNVSAYTRLRLHIFYKHFPLAIDGIVSGGDNTTFGFPVDDRVSGVLFAAGNVGDTTLSVNVTGDGETFASLPAGGEISVGGECMLYTAKTDIDAQTGTLTLSKPLACAQLAGTCFEKLPDYRRGTWDAELETVDASGARLTFTGLKLKIEGGPR